MEKLVELLFLVTLFGQSVIGRNQTSNYSKPLVGLDEMLIGTKLLYTGFKDLKQAFKILDDKLIDNFTEVETKFDKLQDGVKHMETKFESKLQDGATQVETRFDSKLQDSAAQVEKKFDKLQDGVKHMETKFDNKLKDSAAQVETKFDNKLKDSIKQTETKFDNLLQDRVTNVETKFDNELKDSVKQTETKFGNLLQDRVTNVETRLKNRVTNVETKLKDKVTNVETRLKDRLTNGETRFNNKLKDSINHTETKFDNLLQDRVTNVETKFGNELKDSIKQAETKFGNMLQDIVTRLDDKLKDIAEQMEIHFLGEMERVGNLEQRMKYVCPPGWYQYYNKCYYLHEARSTWMDASNYCKSVGAKLVEYTNMQEVDFVLQLALYSSVKWGPGEWRGFFIGGSDRHSEGNFIWETSKRKVEALNWAFNQPDNRRSEHCMGTLVNKQGQWNDGPCDKQNEFVCEKMLKRIQ